MRNALRNAFKAKFSEIEYFQLFLKTLLLYDTYLKEGFLKSLGNGLKNNIIVFSHGKLKFQMENTGYIKLQSC